MPRVLERVRDFPEIRQVQRSREFDVNPFGHVMDSAAGPVIVAADGSEIDNFGSNNYLDLTLDPRVIEDTVAAVRRWGSGCSGSRVLNGTTRLHVELEDELADFAGVGAAMVTTTGFAANTAALTGLADRDEWFVCDRDIHASLADGVRLSGASSTRFAHNDLRSLRLRMETVPSDAPIIGVVEGVYSVDGSLAPLQALADELHARGGALVVDDAHGFGVMGHHGRGTAEHQACAAAVDVSTITFSKALASCGGAVLGPADAIDAVRHRADTYMFAASNVPAAIAAAHSALRILRAEPERVALVRERGAQLRDAIRSAGWRTAPGEAPIVSVRLPNVINAVGTWRLLLELGVYCNAQIPPAVPRGQAALRFSAMSSHTPGQIDRLHDRIIEARGILQRLRGRST